MSNDTGFPQVIMVAAILCGTIFVDPTHLRANDENSTGTKNAVSCGGPVTCFYDQQRRLDRWVTECDLDYYKPNDYGDTVDTSPKKFFITAFNSILKQQVHYNKWAQSHRTRTLAWEINYHLNSKHPFEQLRCSEQLECPPQFIEESGRLNLETLLIPAYEAEIKIQDVKDQLKSRVSHPQALLDSIQNASMKVQEFQDLINGLRPLTKQWRRQDGQADSSVCAGRFHVEPQQLPPDFSTKLRGATDAMNNAIMQIMLSDRGLL